jgi:hypothetical protein
MTRELAYRANDGVEVHLLWDSDSSDLTIKVHDAKSDDVFKLEVAASDGLDAFYHPYAYAAQRGVPYEQALAA